VEGFELKKDLFGYGEELFFIVNRKLKQTFEGLGLKDEGTLVESSE
jgi:hypothetical protein